VTKTFRVSFDRNRYSVPWRLASQTVLVRADDDGGGPWVPVMPVELVPTLAGGDRPRRGYGGEAFSRPALA
jgi:hypothetical protein